MNKIKLPPYNSIPNVGLYLDQTVRFLNDYKEAFNGELTASMITNYVKLKIVPKTKGKLYNREQIALFTLVAVCKRVLTMEQIKQLVLYVNNNLEEYYNTFVEIFEGNKVKENKSNILIKRICDIIMQKIELDEYIENLNL